MICSRRHFALISSALVVFCASAQTSGAEYSLADFMDKAKEHCLAPFENVVPAVRTGLEPASGVNFVNPGMSNAASMWQTPDGLYYLSMTDQLLLDHCAFGVLSDKVRHDSVHHRAVLNQFNSLIEENIAAGRYTLSNQHKANGTLELTYESTIWREPRIEIVFVSNPDAGALHVMVREIDKEA